MKYSRKNIFVVAWVILVFSVVLSVFVRLPFGFFDEQVHYVRSLGIANGQLLTYSKEGSSSKLGHDVDSSNTRFIDRYLGNKTDVISLGWVNNEGEIKSGDDVFVLNTSAAPYTPVSYLPYAAASVISTAINLDVKIEFILMRLFGAISSLTIIAAAFIVAPSRYKWTVLALALVPMSLAAFAGISTDGFTIAIALLFMMVITSAVDMIRKGALSNKHILLLAAVSILLVTSKMPTFLMIALILGLLVIFWKKINKKHKLSFLLIIAVTATTTLAWALYAKNINTGAYWGRNVDTIAQLGYIAEHPLTFIRNLSYSLLNYDYVNVPYNLYADNVFYSSLPFVVDIIVLVGLGLSTLVGVKQIRKPTKEQVWFYWAQVTLFILICTSIFILLYLQFTPVGTPNQIEGIQPRYFLPFLPLLIIMPFRLILSVNLRIFAYSAPLLGAVVYLSFLIFQL